MLTTSSASSTQASVRPVTSSPGIGQSVQFTASIVPLSAADVPFTVIDVAFMVADAKYLKMLNADSWLQAATAVAPLQ